VDDFAIASDTPAVANYIISEIDKCVSTSNKGIGTKYNGVDILQTRDYIKLYCESYLDKVLLSHGWTESSPNESMWHDMVPLSPDAVSRLQNLVGPPKHSQEHAEIEQKLKFSYRGLLGELLYLFIIIHVGIGNAIQFLSKFSSSPIWITTWHLRMFVVTYRNIKQRGSSTGVQTLFSLFHIFLLRLKWLKHNCHPSLSLSSTN